VYAVSFHGCTPAGAKALDDIGFASMGSVDRSYQCAPRLNAPLVPQCVGHFSTGDEVVTICADTLAPRQFATGRTLL